MEPNFAIPGLMPAPTKLWDVDKYTVLDTVTEGTVWPGLVFSDIPAAVEGGDPVSLLGATATWQLKPYPYYGYSLVFSSTDEDPRVAFGLEENTINVSPSDALDIPAGHYTWSLGLRTAEEQEFEVAKGTWFIRPRGVDDIAELVDD